MIRGTNAQYTFNLPYNFADVKIVEITFWQKENDGPSSDRPLPIIKVLKQCSPTDKPKQLSVTLNQEETLRFSDKRKAYVQCRGETLSGIPFASLEKLITVYPVYDDSILGEEILPTPTSDGWVYLDGSTII
jgi:hypothetical protein